MKFSVKPIDPDVLKLADVLPPRTVRRITISAVNDTGKRGETRLNRAIRETLTLSRADVDSAITRQTTDAQGVIGQQVNVTRKTLFFGSYKPRQTKKGISVKFYKAGKRILLAKKAFMAKGRGTNVFRRLGKKRLPITNMKAPTAIGVLTRERRKFADVGEDTGNYLNERFLSKLNYELQKIASKGK